MVQQKPDDRKSSYEKNQSIYFLMGLNGIQKGENSIICNLSKTISKDAVLTQNSLDAILAKAKLLVPD